MAENIPGLNEFIRLLRRTAKATVAAGELTARDADKWSERAGELGLDADRDEQVAQAVIAHLMSAGSKDSGS